MRQDENTRNVEHVNSTQHVACSQWTNVHRKQHENKLIVHNELKMENEVINKIDRCVTLDIPTSY